MEAEGALAAATAEKKKAELDLKRYTKLYKDKMISASENPSAEAIEKTTDIGKL